MVALLASIFMSIIVSAHQTTLRSSQKAISPLTHITDGRNNHHIDATTGCYATSRASNTTACLLAEQRLSLSDLEDPLLKSSLKWEGLPTEMTTKPLQSEIRTTYLRWGRSTCRQPSRMLYDGYAAALQGGSHLVCFPKAPELSDSASAVLVITAADFLDSRSSTQAVSCAMCGSSKTTSIMVPGRKSCANDWKEEYTGFLMSAGPAFSSLICVDSQLQKYGEETPYSEPQPQLSFVQTGVCSGQPCSEYKQPYKVPCVVCTL